MSISRLLYGIAFAAAGLTLSACGSDSANLCYNCTAPVAIQFNGTVSGLATGTSLVLVDNTGTTTNLSTNGSFTYQTYAASYAYPPALGVLQQPLGQTCGLNTSAASPTGAITVTASCAATSGTPSQLSMLAGALLSGSADNTGISAAFSNPSAVATDALGNAYVADSNNHTIRKITPAGVVTTLAGAAGVAGSTDGTGAAARFNYPNGIAIDGSGNLYVADTGNQTLRLITPAGVVSTIAGTALTRGSANGTGTAATFFWPMGVTVNSAGTQLFVSDYGSNTIRAISTVSAPMTAANTTVSTLAGTAGLAGSTDGAGASARFYGPQGLHLDASGNLYVADTWNNTLRYINTTNAQVTTFAGTAGLAGSANGITTAATFNGPLDVTTDTDGNLYVIDSGNYSVRKITLSTNTVSTVVGAPTQDIFNAGPLAQASLWQPTAVAITGTAPNATLLITTANGVAAINAVP